MRRIPRRRTQPKTCRTARDFWRYAGDAYGDLAEALHRAAKDGGLPPYDPLREWADRAGVHAGLCSLMNSFNMPVSRAVNAVSADISRTLDEHRRADPNSVESFAWLGAPLNWLHWPNADEIRAAATAAALRATVAELMYYSHGGR